MLPLSPDLPFKKIKFQITDPQHRLHSQASRTPGKRLKACMQFSEGEGLNQVVVSARFKPFNMIIESIKGRQEQDGRMPTGTANYLDEPDTVEARQHPVYNQDIICFAGREEKTVMPIYCMVDTIPMSSQALDNMFRRFCVIFDQQYFHHRNSFSNVSIRIIFISKAFFCKTERP